MSQQCDIDSLVIELNNDLNDLAKLIKTNEHPNKKYNNDLIFSRTLFDVQKALQNGANINAQDSIGSTALHYAVILLNGFEIVKYLIENNADPNIKDYDGNTPLKFAIRWNKPEIIKILLSSKRIIIDEHDSNLLKKIM